MKAANFLAPNWPTNIPAKIQIETFVKLSRGRLGLAGTVPSIDVPTVVNSLERNAIICWAFPDNPLFRRVETRPNTLFDAIFVYLILVQVREYPLLHVGTVFERLLWYKGNAERIAPNQHILWVVKRKGAVKRPHHILRIRGNWWDMRKW